MDFDLAVDADSVLEPSVCFRNDGGEAPSVGGLDFLDEVDAVRVVGSVEKCSEGLESGHPKSPPLGHSLSSVDTNVDTKDLSY
jgi:hypothetical protein